jgi:hypothetical protein
MLALRSPHWNVCGNMTWRLVIKRLHIVACELHCIDNIKVFVATIATIATCLMTLKII